MNTCLLVFWCNLAIALGASLSHQPRGLSVRPARSLTLKTRQEVPSVASTTTSILTTISSRSINDAELQQESHTVETANELRQQDTSEGFQRAETALKEHYYAMKSTMEHLQNSYTTLQVQHVELELEKVFLNANGAIMLVQAYSGEISSLTGVSKQELDTFFADLSHDISGLHQALAHSDHKADDFKLFFTELLARISKLQISSENSKAKSQQVTAFFTALIEMISNLEKALGVPNQTPVEYDVEIKGFFMKLGSMVANLEAEMGKGVVSD